MISLIATIVFVAGIAGLFYMDRDADAPTSKALWVPILWMLIVGSRQMSSWLSPNSDKSAAHFSEGNTTDALTFAILIGVGLLVLNFRSRKVMAILRENAPLLMFLAYCAISVLWSDSPIVSLKRWVKAAGVFAMVLIVLTDNNPLEATKRFFSRTAFLLMPLSVLFIVFYPNLGTAYDQSARITYYIGVTTQKNELGLSSLVCGLGSLWSFLGAYRDRKMPHRARHMIAHGLMLLTALWLIKKCDSMTSMSCLAIAGAVMIMTTHPWVSKKAGNIHILVGSAVATAIFAAFLDTSGALLRLLGRNATLTGRTEIWKAVLSLNTNPLVGTGYESFWLGDRIEKVWRMIGFTGIAEAHNGYIETYINLGGIGLFLLCVVLFTAYRHALDALRTHPHAGRLSMAFFTAGLIYNLTEAGFKMMTPLWIAFLLEITCIPGIVPRPQVSATPLTLGEAPRKMRILR